MRVSGRSGVVADPGMCARFLYHGNREISRLAAGLRPAGPHREDEESKPMTHEREKSDPAIVAGKPANNASVCKTDIAERVERHGEAMRSAWAAGTKGNAGEQSTRRVQDRASVSSSSHFGAPCCANRAAALNPLGSTAPEPSVFCIENKRLRGLGSCAHQAGLGGSPFAKRSWLPK